MNSIRHVATTMLAVVVLLAFADANAQARGQSLDALRQLNKVDEGDPEAARVAKLVELDSWLRRLVGRFDATSASVVLGSGTHGVLVDCVGIGEGSGVQCLAGGRASAYMGSVFLFGLDTDAQTIRYMEASMRGTVAYGTGRLNGDTVIFKMQCNWPQDVMNYVRSCDREMKISVSPDSMDVQIQTEYTVSRGMRSQRHGFTEWLKRVPPLENTNTP